MNNLSMEGVNSLKENIYIVYDPDTLRIIKEYDWCGQAYDYAERHNLSVANRTHPINKELLTTLIK